jgi:SAM-dependent methyltransferase
VQRVHSAYPLMRRPSRDSMPSCWGMRMEVCNLCGGTQWKTLEQVAATRVVRCACGFVFVTPQPPRSSLEAAYDQAYYLPWEKQAGAREKIWRDRVQRVAHLAPPPGRLLDVGCGTGAFLRLARDRGWDVQGTEFSRDAVRAAQADGLSVVGGEIWEAEFPAASFDIVTSWHVLEHVPDPRRFIREIHRILRPGGRLVLATPNLDDWIFRIAYLLARRRWPRFYEADEREIHLFFFSASTLRRLIASTDFKDIIIKFDRGAAATRGKRFANEIAYAWYLLTKINWGIALEITTQKPMREGQARSGPDPHGA